MTQQLVAMFCVSLGLAWGSGALARPLSEAEMQNTLGGATIDYQFPSGSTYTSSDENAQIRANITNPYYSPTMVEVYYNGTKEEAIAVQTPTSNPVSMRVRLQNLPLSGTTYKEVSLRYCNESGSTCNLDDGTDTERDIRIRESTHVSKIYFHNVDGEGGVATRTAEEYTEYVDRPEEYVWEYSGSGITPVTDAALSRCGTRRWNFRYGGRRTSVVEECGDSHMGGGPLQDSNCELSSTWESAANAVLNDEEYMHVFFLAGGLFQWNGSSYDSVGGRNFGNRISLINNTRTDANIVRLISHEWGHGQGLNHPSEESSGEEATYCEEASSWENDVMCSSAGAEFTDAVACEQAYDGTTATNHN